jgi:hypothetical protein
MLNPVEQVRAIDSQRLYVRFADGVEGEVDLAALIGQGAFAELADPAAFARVGIDEFGAVSWSTGADLAPDAMHAALRRDGRWQPRFTRATQDA